MKQWPPSYNLVGMNIKESKEAKRRFRNRACLHTLLLPRFKVKRTCQLSLFVYQKMPLSFL